MPVSESENIIKDWSTCLHPPKRAQHGIVVPTALIYKYCFYLEVSTQEDMEKKMLQSWHPVAQKTNILKMSKCTYTALSRL